MNQQSDPQSSANEWKLVPVTADLRMVVAGGVALTEASQSDLEATVSELQACYAAMVAAAPTNFGKFGENTKTPTQPAQDGGEVPQWLRDVCRYISETLADGSLSTGERKVARTIMHMLPLDGLRATPPAAEPVAAESGAVVEAREVARQVFALCEQIEGLPESPADSFALERFTAGQRFAAKQIRRGIGTWLTDEENIRAALSARPQKAGRVAVALTDEQIVDALQAAGANLAYRDFDADAVASRAVERASWAANGLTAP